MNKTNAGEVKRGQTISFRVPSDIPDHLLKQLQKLKETERRNFSSKIAEFVVEGVGTSFSRERESITIPLPHRLSKAQRDWIKHEHSEALLGSIVYQLLNDPVRTASLLASLNSNRTDIDEALYLQEDVPMPPAAMEPADDIGEALPDVEPGGVDDDLDAFDWASAKRAEPESELEGEEPEADLDELLGDFLAKMNN
ncbi:hypothetical protein [Mesobacillus zeae]|uniref:Uncharacterized protein n=1 Tax=Mesobacillus zeae TaxID=1917180 RepID=A0A398BAC3_9BACI|nr:hypothetical protein [Mesobacillus zeae]RID86767.1 hypothetical protein D1970_05790 [Mesobacillus zeae]